MFSHETFNQTETNFNHIYLGVVEDNNDPDKAGKVQVRIAGLHTPKKSQSNTEGIPTEELPWALPMMPITSGAVSGLGYNGVPVQGDWVALFFIGGNHNNPVYFGTLKSKPVTPVDSSKGFNDPKGKYPLETDKADWNKEARYDGSEELKSLKDGNVETFEPSSPAEPVYPNNTVFETPDGGIVVEYDSTPTKERWHVFHKASKSYIEIGPNGDMVMKSTGDKYEISAKGRKIFVKDNDVQQIDGNLTITVAGDATLEATNIKLDVSTVIDALAATINLGSGAEKAVLGDTLAILYAAHTHLTTSPGNPTSIPSNVLTTALSNKVNLD
jgi:hypothetical protein